MSTYDIKTEAEYWVQKFRERYDQPDVELCWVKTREGVNTVDTELYHRGIHIEFYVEESHEP